MPRTPASVDRTTRWETDGMAKTESTPSTPDPNDPRERFRLALEAKKSKGGYGAAASDSGSASGKDHSNRTGGKREFRRKSG